MADPDSPERLRARVAARSLPLLDLTSLGDDDTEADVDELARAAGTPHGPVAAVCVWPRFISTARRRLDETGANVGVASVANFPDGDPDPERAASDTIAVLDAGGDEIDVVFPWRSLIDGDELAGHRVVAAARAAAGSHTLKVILETGELAEADLIARAGAIALDEGADFLKTSTGKTATSATPDAVRVLLELIGRSGAGAGIKVSGGVRTVDQAADYLTLADEVMGPDWVSATTFRFGASSLLQDLLDALGPADDDR